VRGQACRDLPTVGGMRRQSSGLVEAASGHGSTVIERVTEDSARDPVGTTGGNGGWQGGTGVVAPGVSRTDRPRTGQESEPDRGCCMASRCTRWRLFEWSPLPFRT